MRGSGSREVSRAQTGSKALEDTAELGNAQGDAGCRAGAGGAGLRAGCIVRATPSSGPAVSTSGRGRRRGRLVGSDTLGTPVGSLSWHPRRPLLLRVRMGQAGVLRKLWFSTSGLRHTFTVRLKSRVPASELGQQGVVSQPLAATLRSPCPTSLCPPPPFSVPSSGSAS